MHPRTDNPMTAADYSQLSDGTLIAAAQTGDRAAIDALIGRYRSPLFRTAWSRLGRPDWADDAVQETLLCVFKSLRTYDSRYSFRTWLWTVLLNQCRRQAAKRARRMAAESQATQHPADSTTRSAQPNPADELLARERTGELAQLLQQLPEAQADALRLRFYAGLKFPEIAFAMKCSLTTAKHRVRMGLAQLAQWLKQPSEDRSRELRFDGPWEF